ncbi:SRPBCC domain-containing protein [Streptomyces olivaceoviridis]|uniref:SRPBCC domain-containing protein n=1 Tax=Streptomyces olivaceoviridis TaxID=1921 RepID=UPI00331E0A89
MRGLIGARIRRFLTDTATWESYCDNVADISFPQGGGPVLEDGLAFRFGIFGRGCPGPAAWTARQDGAPEEGLDVPHVWLVEDLPGGRVRILTQETQIGRPAAALARQTPNPVPNGHQAWLDGLVRAAEAA